MTELFSGYGVGGPRVDPEADVLGVLVLRTEFGDPVVDQLMTEIPSLQYTMAITARRVGMEPSRFAQWLHEQVIEHGLDHAGTTRSPDRELDKTFDARIELLVELIDPGHESPERAALKEQISTSLGELRLTRQVPLF